MTQPISAKPTVHKTEPVRKREVARIQLHAIHVTPPHTQRSTQTFDPQAQQAQFEKTIAKLREENNPVESAARPVQTPETARRFNFDISGSIGTAPHGEGILTPLQSWHADGYDYYYVRYWVEYPDGTTETGIVPWPLRYLPAVDPFRLGIQHFPLPVPLAGYALPAGTALHPLVAYCYEHRSELPSCPIYHD